MKIEEIITEASGRSKTNRLNNVKKIAHMMGWKKPMFVDKMTHGYRFPLGDWSKEETQKLADKVKKELGITGLKFRNRGGYARPADHIDMIVPFYNGDDEPLQWTK